MTPRQIEKLKAIGYDVQPIATGGNKSTGPSYAPWHSGMSEAEAWQCAMAHASSPEGMVATMAAKVKWLCGKLYPLSIGCWKVNKRFVFAATVGVETGPQADSPEAAVHALWEAVP
jgi:hypothetical protein